ncbi:hypothetical protein EMIHUDRAFT_229589 [Emiliania huxleyi CCMP1516]|uniref:Methyltransferase domain-containing protein n=2 Tax=Emiliania huxleyi TaxID=2903 RepID=A0A0D3KCI9_EMIH1|nr:hypothetical protein EMIHUDRAFT_229589 [Emiliania huxleyi CCMP1516]EOD33474.1 hypothetical protein EMIHUDRAFT_229589 [Emiliania huxleyi CCMP1516]|eukprot:XP_005785903.1 hypothetical protein EMIHUDRAFT_229589 [Emiliania huxleyi CCMP1516]
MRIDRLSTGQALTQNGCGMQMATASPLAGAWIDAYDGHHPIVDVGCAYGLAVKEAAARSVPVLAIDCCEEHLEAVLHFLNGPQCDRALAALHATLVPGGLLFVTAQSVEGFLKVVFPDGNAEARRVRDGVAKRAAAGERWPGTYVMESEDVDLEQIYSGVLRESVGAHLPPEALRAATPKYEVVHTAQHLRAGAERAGLIVVSAVETSHPGYPDGADVVQLVARRPL